MAVYPNKNFIFTLICFFFFNETFSQTNTYFGKITYIQSVKNNSGFYDEKNKFTTFFNSTYYMYNSIQDSKINFEELALKIIKKKYGDTQPVDSFELKKIADVYRKQHESKVKNTFKTVDIINGVSYSNRKLNNLDFCVVDTFKKINWKIFDDTLTINGVLCQKAEGLFVDKLYKVYFSLEHKFSIGPYYMCGLPGLIMYAESITGKTKFELTNLEYPSTSKASSTLCDIKSQQVSSKIWNELTKKAIEEKKSQVKN